MTAETLKYAEEKGFRLITKISSVNGRMTHLVKENVEIFVESWNQADHWHHASDRSIIEDIDDFENLRRQQEEQAEYVKQLFA